jgi:polyhydroxyalkanoate synthase
MKATRQGAAPARRGPRPLPQHLAVAGLSWLSSPGAWRLWSGVSKSSKRPAPGPVASPPPELESALAGVDPEEFAGALETEALLRLERLAIGIERYQSHPYRREGGEPPAIWRQGTTRLLDYSAGAAGASRSRSRGRAASAPPVLVVPSLVNRAYVVDLEPQRSFMRFLAGAGYAPYLVDWGAPGEIERGFDLTDYIAGRLSAALDVVAARHAKTKIHLVGYCMGGNLALALALRRAASLAGLVLLATPWDFHAERAEQAEALGALGELLAPAIAASGELSVDGIQSLFGVLDPLQVSRKFLAFGALDPGSAKAQAFVALEDWVNDGVPLAAAVAIECLGGWYGRNSPMRGEWRIEGRPVLPRDVSVPALVVLPDQDRIVPPASAAPLAVTIPGADSLRPEAGHIGMMVGGSAETKLWQPLLAWLRARA